VAAISTEVMLDLHTYVYTCSRTQARKPDSVRLLERSSRWFEKIQFSVAYM